MAEIKTPITALPEGVPYTPGPNEFVITEKHTIADVVRWIVALGMEEDVRLMLEENVVVLNAEDSNWFVETIQS